MGSPAFDLDHDVTYGTVDRLSPTIERVTANNPSKFTFRGTGTYLVGDAETVVLVDPGPRDDDHEAALRRAIGDRSLNGVLITHTHGDHSPLAASFDADTWGYGPHPAAATSESGDDSAVADDDSNGTKGGSDTDFHPDHLVDDGYKIVVGPFEFVCLHTPGHISNHLCFAYPSESAVFTGDHIMGWSTTIIPPPDGNMADYVASLERFLSRDDAVLYPTHGPPITKPRTYVEALIAHRREREEQIADVLARGPSTIGEIVQILYADVAEELHKPAARSVEAHLVSMVERGAVDRVEIEGHDDLYRRNEP